MSDTIQSERRNFGKDANQSVFVRKTIVYIGHTAVLGGAEIALLRLLQTLDTQRYRPILVLSSDGPLCAKMIEAGIETHVLPLSPHVVHTRKDTLGVGASLRLNLIWPSLRYAMTLARFLRSCRADLVHTNTLKSDIFGGIAGRLVRIPVVWHVRDRIDNDYLPGVTVRMFRFLCRTVPDFIIANSAATLATLHVPEYIRRKETSPDVVTSVTNSMQRVIHDGVKIPINDACANQPANHYKEGARFAPVIGMVGRLSPWKGQHIFVEAAALVRARWPHCRFQIVGAALFGEEDYVEAVRRRVRELGLEDCLEFTGFQQDVTQLLRQFFALVHASTVGEPFGQVVIEGMAAGLPVVATSGGAIPEIIVEGTTGFIVPMADATALANALSQLIEDPERARQMGNAGCKRVQESFSIDLTARRVEEVYAKLLLSPA